MCLCDREYVGKLRCRRLGAQYPGLAYTVLIFVAKRELYLGAIIRVLNAVLLGVYFGEYIFLVWVQEYVNQESVAIVVAVIVVIIVLILLYWLDNAALMLGLVVVMASYGLVWWAVGLISIAFVAFAAVVIWQNELSYLSMCMLDSAVLSVDLMASLVGLFTNFWPSNAPLNCGLNHVNMILICQNACGSILTDGNVKWPAYAWGILVGALTAARFFWVYWKEVCGRNAEVKKRYEDLNPRKQRQCCCDDNDFWFCLCRCCYTGKEYSQDTAKKPPSAALEEEPALKELEEELERQPV